MSPARLFPALDLVWPSIPDADTIERVLAEIDDASPAAVEDLTHGVRVFFTTEADRARALPLAEAARSGAVMTALTVSDEAWAERSQAALRPITVGRITVAPPWAIDAAASEIVIAIQPSMGFGTGHHQSTRLCLGLLQGIDARGRAVLDVGTGSGVLALAAWRLGADPVVAIDYDPDAVTSARENLERNDATAHISLDVADVSRVASGLAGRFGLLLANLTGGVLIRFAPQLVACVADGGALITSGFQTDEIADVAAAFEGAGAIIEHTVTEDSWVALQFTRAIGPSPSASTAR